MYVISAKVVILNVKSNENCYRAKLIEFEIKCLLAVAGVLISDQLLENLSLLLIV